MLSLFMLVLGNNLGLPVPTSERVGTAGLIEEERMKDRVQLLLSPFRR